MDPITHALVGMGVGALSGQTLTPYNPIYCAAVMGAIIPDLDIVTMLKGEVSLVKHHRGPTHSIGGLLLLSAITAAVVFIDFGGNMLQYLFWALAGGLSHVLLDSLNPYGAQIFWPFSRKRWAANLFMFYDPVFMLLFIPVLFMYQAPQVAGISAIVATMVYLVLRWKFRLNVQRYLQRKYNLKPHRDRLAVMPALKGLSCWDFLIERPREIILGSMNSFGLKEQDNQSLNRKNPSPVALKALQTKLGRFFKQFTSHYYVMHWEEQGKHFVKLMDLRFKRKTDFFYRATFVYNEEMNLEEAYFHKHNESFCTHESFPTDAA